MTSADLAALLEPAAQARLYEALDEVAATPARIAVLFPAVARSIARGPTDPADPDGLIAPRIEDHVRGALLRTAARHWNPAEHAEEVAALYRYGDADEKRAVLRALDHLDIGGAALPLVVDALRSNDTRLIAAALGAYAARHLDGHAWRHGVLKCLFTGVPLDAISGVADRIDAELTRMVDAYIAERRAAGRPVPHDAQRLLGDWTRRNNADL
ncbi:EboA domain-containing protein [Saccharopolyspora sp. NPDC002376]